MCHLPTRDQEGNEILSVRLTDLDATKFSCFDVLKTYIMVQDAIMVETGTVPGYVFLLDLKGCGVGHLARVSISCVKLYADYIQVYIRILLSNCG